MKKLLFTVATVAFFSFSVQAQDAQAPDEKAMIVVENLLNTGDVHESETEEITKIMAHFYVNLKNAAYDELDEEAVQEIYAKRDIQIRDHFGDERAEVLLQLIAENEE